MDFVKIYRDSGSYELHAIGKRIKAEAPKQDAAEVNAIEARAKQLSELAAKQEHDVVALTLMLKERDETLAHFVRRCLAAERKVIEQDAIIRGRKLPDPSAIHSAIGAV